MTFLNFFGHGGGKIKRKSITVVLLLFALALSLSANTVFATNTTTISDQNSSQISQSTGQNLNNVANQTKEQQTTTNQKTTVTNNQTSTQKTVNDENSNSDNIAAGSTQSATTTVSTTQTSFSSSQINDASSRVKTFIDTNHRLPNYVTISNLQVSMPQFLQLLTDNLLNINSGSTTSITLDTVNNPSNPSEDVKSGNIYKSEYITLAQSIKTAIDTKGTAPDYINSTLGKIRYESLIYTFSKILAFQNTNQRLPNYVSVAPWTSSSSSSSGQTGTSSEGSSIPSSLQQYLQPTANAQSTSSTIVSLANSITSGLTTDYDKATAIFNWVRDHISYSFYYNTQKGALGTLSSRTANCCDTSHLVVALARAAGIPARYQLGNCQFSDGWYGHVWAQLYVNGKWYYADAISKQNTFGVINNWNLNNYTLRGTYASLPF